MNDDLRMNPHRVGDKVWIYLFSLPDHPLTQYYGVGAGDFRHAAGGDKYAYAVREVKVVAIEGNLVRVEDPIAQVFENGKWGPPLNRKGEPEKVRYVYHWKQVFYNEGSALQAARDHLNRLFFEEKNGLAL